MSDKNFLKSYFQTLKDLIDPEKYIDDLESVKYFTRNT